MKRNTQSTVQSLVPSLHVSYYNFHILCGSPSLKLLANWYSILGVEFSPSLWLDACAW